MTRIASTGCRPSRLEHRARSTLRSFSRTPPGSLSLVRQVASTRHRSERRTALWHSRRGEPQTPISPCAAKAREGARRKAVPASRRRLTRGQTQEGGFLDAPGGASDGPPSVGCPARVLECRSAGVRDVVRVDRHARHEVTDMVDPVPGVDEPGQDVARGAEACVEDRGSHEALLDQKHALALGQVERDARVLVVSAVDQALGRAVQRPALPRGPRGRLGRKHQRGRCGVVLRVVLVVRRLPFVLAPVVAAGRGNVAGAEVVAVFQVRLHGVVVDDERRRIPVGLVADRDGRTPAAAAALAAVAALATVAALAGASAVAALATVATVAALAGVSALATVAALAGASAVAALATVAALAGVSALAGVPA